MDAVKLISAYIEVQHGTPTAKQFEDSYENSNFEEQNEDAIAYVLNELKLILKEDLITERFTHELEDYARDLESFLSDDPTIDH